MKRKVNYKMGAMKRKYKTGKNTKPGDLISKVNESKIKRKTVINQPSKRKVAIMGLV